MISFVAIDNRAVIYIYIYECIRLAFIYDSLYNGYNGGGASEVPDKEDGINKQVNFWPPHLNTKQWASARANVAVAAVANGSECKNELAFRIVTGCIRGRACKISPIDQCSSLPLHDQ